MCAAMRLCKIGLAREVDDVKTQEKMRAASADSAHAMRHDADSIPDEVEVERRIKPRIYKPFHAKVRGVNAGGEAFEVSTVLDNMSSGGLYLRVEQDVKQGSGISIIIRLSTKKVDLIPVANVAVEGVVVRNEAQPRGVYGLGISISNRRFVS